MNSGVSILLSSRGRPKRFSTCAGSARKRASGPVEIVAYLDEDDPELAQYQLDGITPIIGPSVNVGKRCRAMAEKAKYDFFYLCGDDAVFITQGWDVLLKEKLHEDGIGIVFSLDGWKNSPGHCMFTRKLTSLVDVFPDEFIQFGLDTYLADMVREVKRYDRVDSVMIEHHHYRNGKAEQDETYRMHRDSLAPQTDHAMLTNLRKHKLGENVKTLKAEIERFSSARRSGDATGAQTRDEQTRSLPAIPLATQVP